MVKHEPIGYKLVCLTLHWGPEVVTDNIGSTSAYKTFHKRQKLFGFRMRGAWRPSQRRYHQDILEQRKLIITNVENRDIA